MYLSRLILNPRSPAVRRDIADCHQMHRTILTAFPQTDHSARQAFNILHRLEIKEQGAMISLLVQSQVMPDWSRLPDRYLVRMAGNPACKDVTTAYAGITDDAELRFRLLANPTKKTERPGMKNGKRVFLGDPNEQLDWLVRKAEAGGFQLVGATAESEDLQLIIESRPETGGWVQGRRESATVEFGGVLFEGRLRVTNQDRFRATLELGIGSGKAYGFGLLSVGRG